MYISQIAIRDWKAYTTAHFEFPAPTPEKNIVLIGAPNGYGKTSLFEAIVLGMFGRDGLHLIARSPFSGSDTNRLTTSYKKFLEKALHRGAVASGRCSCSVKLTFIDDNDDDTLEIKRIWHFSNSGDYRPQDEEFHIFEGATRKAVGPPAYNSDLDAWRRDYVAKKFLPSSLADFFLFDGERVSVFAEREMAEQVRTGVEGLLGIPIMKELADDLRAYARNRRQQTPSVSNKTIEKLEIDRDELKSQLDEKTRRLDEIEPDLIKLKEEREDLTRELASFGVSSQAQLQEQLEQLNQYRRAVDSGRIKLEEMLAKDISLALAGLSLRRNLKERLASEGIRKRWETGKQQGDSNLERFLGVVGQNIGKIVPILTEPQRTSILNIARKAWEQLWYPPPEDCAETYLHPYLDEQERGRVIDRLEELSKHNASTIVELLNSITANENALEKQQEEIRRTEGVQPYVDQKRERLSALHDQIQELNQETGALKRERDSLESQVNTKNTKLAQLSSELDQAKPSMRRATRAHLVAGVVDEIVKKAVPSQINAIAKTMTTAYRSMAHKKDMVERVDIDEDCNVKLLNSAGTDVRHYDLSAGEKQIFTQALFSAVSSVSRRGFPTVVDTPLGRLDIEHRKGVLNHLTERPHQVILLSTNTEVVGDYLKEIESNILKKYMIYFERVGEIGQSRVSPGYFDDMGTAA